MVTKNNEEEEAVEIHCTKSHNKYTAYDRYLEDVVAHYGIEVYTCYDKENGIYAHNKVRKLHGVSDLVWDETLALEARKYAYYLAAADKWHHSSFINSDGERYGECLYRASDGEFLKDQTFKHRGSRAVYYWYKEILDYDFDNPDQYNHDEDKVEKIGHFTQLVWNTTKRFGLAISMRKDTGRYFVVARYMEAGNNAYGNTTFRDHVFLQEESLNFKKDKLIVPSSAELKPPDDREPVLELTR